MSRCRGATRKLLLGLALAALASGCQSTPGAVSISPKSSMLAVEVLYPVPLRRDPDLVQVFLVRGPIHGGLQELPELIPATFVKNSRAYLLDPQPGTYSLVAVSSAVAAPRDDYPVAGGVYKTTLPGTIANALILPADLIRRTRTTVAHGGVGFMGTLRVTPGERINADTVFQDPLQQRIAERIHPDATSMSGMAGWFTRAWTVDLEQTSLGEEAADRASFLDGALADLGDSPWAQVVARAAPPEAPAAAARTPAARPTHTAPVPAPTPAPAPAPEIVATESPFAVTEPEPVAPRQEPPPPNPPNPPRRAVAGLPPDSPLAAIEYGMRFDEVLEILGDPDHRIDRQTSKAWIPFYNGPGAYLRDWIYEGEGRVIFSLHGGSLEVIDVVYDPAVSSSR